MNDKHLKVILTILLLFLTIPPLLSQTDQKIARSPKINYDWRPGFVSITELTGGIGLADTGSDMSKYYYGITTVAGYQFTRNIKAGAGVGVQVHNEGTLFPVYLDVRLNLNAQEFIPFISGAGGLLLNLNDIVEETRVFINPMVGLRYVAANRKAVSLSTGLMISTGGPAERKSFINFKLGVELKGK